MLYNDLYGRTHHKYDLINSSTVGLPGEVHPDEGGVRGAGAVGLQQLQILGLRLQLLKEYILKNHGNLCHHLLILHVPKECPILYIVNRYIKIDKISLT